jgi:4-amino-4-deoxy-L-arabinose transferase-like glycosyltransferase
MTQMPETAGAAPAPERRSSVRRSRRYRTLLRGLFWLALVVRLSFVVFVHPPRDFLYSDMASYHVVALELLRGVPNPWHAFRPVGYSMVLAASYLLSDASVTLVGVWQALMGAALVPLTARLARAAGASRGAALAAALAVASSLPLIFYSGVLLTEVPTSFFMMLGLSLALRSRARRGATRYRRLALAGLSLGTAAALRPNLLLLCPLALLFLLARDGRAGLRANLRGALLSAAMLLAPVALVSAYNSKVLARPAGPSCNGGLNFYLNFVDVRAVQYHGPLGAYWVSPVPNGFDFTRTEISTVPLFEERHYYAAGLKYLREHPRALLRALRNFVEAAGLGRQLYWPNWPGREGLFRAYALAFSGVALAPALGWLLALLFPRVRSRARPEALLVGALCLASIVPMYLFLGDPRVRVPFDPLWCVLAVLGYQAVWRALAALRRRPRVAVDSCAIPPPP